MIVNAKFLSRHRVKDLEDRTFMKSVLPHLDDVVRVEDDFNRK